MIFTETKLKGAFVIDIETIEDERGFFARCGCVQEFKAHGLISQWVQSNISFNTKKGTLRGMHFQKPPHEEAKLVRCTQGAIFDVIIDLRPDSPTYKQWVGEELTAQNRKTIYVPETFAHGFVSLTDSSEVLYQMSAPYVAESAAGIRWDDPAINIAWPLKEGLTISEKDQAFAYL